jgi:hypothetical protein
MRRSGHPGDSQVPAVRGRPFADGNSGRKPGSKNRGTIIAAALLEGDAEALLRKAIEVALSGDVPMLRFLLGRILPRDRVIKIGLPQMEFADDGVKALGYVRGMTPRELMRERAVFKKSDCGECLDSWPRLVPAEFLKLPDKEKISFISRNRDFHHASLARPNPASKFR